MKPVLPRLVHRALVFGFCGLLAACATRPPPAPTEALLHDEFFGGAVAEVDTSDIFAMNPAMLAYANKTLVLGNPQRDVRRTFIEALYAHGQLRLNYDAGNTRNAAQAFEARAGNCLSLVIMTAAFAKHLGLPISFQAVQVDEMYTRTSDLTLASGHVNLVLGPVAPHSMFTRNLPNELTVDFLSIDEIGSQRTLPLTERTVTAMYLNNRAAEALADGQLAESYRWARAAVLQDPGFTAAANTLAVVYLRSAQTGAAEQALRHVLAAEPDNAAALSNLSITLRRDGRAAEALLVETHLKQVQPVPPLYAYDLGRRAMAAGNFREARDHFKRELRLQPYHSEVHFWAAQAYWQLGEQAQAARHLRQAMENSSTRGSHDLYAAKLEKLRALNVH